MFSKACQLAATFTHPVVLFRVNAAGQVSAGIGTFILLNEDGWALTAFHILRQILTADEEAKKNESRDAEAAAIRASGLSQPEKQKKLRTLGHAEPLSTANYVTWWGLDGVQTGEWFGIEGIDIAAIRLNNLPAGAFKGRPKLKDPAKGLPTGTSLCKLGFPFHDIQPIWHSVDKRFEFPAGALPFPLFPMDGILARHARVITDPPTASTFPLTWIETSTPGLRGQSGGPTFDVNGTIWGIQANTASYDLGFDPEVPGRKGHRERQFLNVGRGVSVETIVPMLQERGVAFDLADY